MLVEHVSRSVSEEHGFTAAFHAGSPGTGTVVSAGYSAATYMDVLMGVYRQLATAGFVVFGIDPRGQGASKAAHQPSEEGKLLTGISSPDEHIMRGILADCVQGARYLAHRAGVSKIGVGGHSQGAGLALMTASVAPELVGSVTAMIPFLTHYRLHAQRRHQVGPYREITTYIEKHPDAAESVLNVLSYFDTLPHAPRIHAPTLVGVGLEDATCPPDSVLALHDALICMKGLLSFPKMGHVHSPLFYHYAVHWHRLHLAQMQATLADLKLGI